MEISVIQTLFVIYFLWSYLSLFLNKPLQYIGIENYKTIYNVDTLSTTVRTSSQVTLEIGQMFLNLKIL